MAEFRTYAQPGGYQQIQLPDVAAKLAERDRKLLEDIKEAAQYDISNRQRNLQATMAAQQAEAANRDQIFKLDQDNRDRVQQATLRNYEQQIKNVETNSKSRLDTLKALGSFSTTAVDAYQKAVTAFDEARTLAVHKTIYDTGISLKQMLELQKLGDNMTTQTLRESESLQRMAQDTGISINELLYLAQNSKSKYWNEATAFSQQIGYGWQEALQKNLTTPFDYNGQETNLIQAREYGNVEAERYGYNLFLDQYRKESGMLSMSVQAIEKNVNPILRSIENQHFTAANAKAREVISNDAAQAETLALTQIAFSQGGVGIINSINEAPNRGVQQDKWFNLLSTWASSADPDMRARAQDIVTQMAGSTIDYNGKQMLYGDLQRGNAAWLNILDALEKGRARDIQRYNLEQTERSIEAATFTNNVIQAAERQGIAISEADLDNLEAELRNRYAVDGQSVPGNALAIIDEYRKNSTIEAAAGRQMTEQLTDLADRGQLTLERLRQLGIPLHRVPGELLAVARATSQDYRSNDNFKPQMEALKDMARTPPQIQAKSQGQWHWSVGLMEQKLQNRFLTKYSELKAAGDPNAVNNAFTYVQQQFQSMIKSPSAFSKDSGYSEFINRRISPSANVGAARMQWVQSNLGRLGARTLDSNGSIFTISELNEIERNMKRPGFRIDPMAEYMGRLLGVDPLTVINRQRIAAGMTPVELPEAKIQFDREADPRFNRLFQQFPTPNTSRRAMISTGTFNSGTIPNGYGTIIQEAANANGIPPGEIAALMEIESSFNPNARSRTGALGLMQIQPDAHPGYNGGLDPRANIAYGSQYYASLRRMFGGDPVKAAGAYNAGPGRFDEYLKNGRPLPQETVDHMRKFSQALAKYGDTTQLQSRHTMRNSMQRMGQPRFERPASVNYESSSGQPGVDLWFESKRFPAVLDGVVKDVSREPGYGNYIVIESTDPNTGMKVDVLYAHLADGIALRPGQQIYAGDIIGTQGGTGNVRSADGTIASIDFLAPAPRGSKSIAPYSGFNRLRRWVVQQLQR